MGLKIKIVLAELTLNEPIGLKMMMSSPRENIFEGKEEKYLFWLISL